MKKHHVFLAAVILITASITWYTYYNNNFAYLFLNDAMDYASIGRNIARGDGFVSSYITPLGLANKEGLPHPDLWRAPLWPAVLGLYINIFGPTDQAVAIAAGSFFIAGAVMVFLLGSVLFNRAVGFISALIYIFSAQNLLNSISGMTEPISVFMMLLAVYMVVGPRFQNRWGDILAGAVMGLFYLTRYNALLFVPFFALFILFRRRVKNYKSLLPAVRYLAAFALVVSPWLIRNWLIMGSPLFSLQKFEPVMFTATYPGYSMYMMLDKVNVLEFIKAHPLEIWDKINAGWHEFRKGFFDPEVTGVSPYIMGTFLISLFIPFNRSANRNQLLADSSCLTGVRPLLTACYLTQLSALLVIHFIYRLFFIFMPFYIIFGVAGVIWLLTKASEKLPVKKANFALLCTAVFAVLCVYTNLPSPEPVRKEDMPVTILREQIKAVTDMSGRDSLILSNDGHLLAWYGDRYAAKLPYSPEMIPEVEKLAPVKFIYLSSRINWNIPEAYKNWGELYWSKPQEVYGFKLVRVFPDGGVIYKKH